ncbi:Cell division protein FtsZ [Pontiella desulfatans]|uniref:Cell division protein FtsZ n=1 Tax=Pontiella desulfatans TaxID=2750659 RepID=A0A6C2U5V7_PONDE|nr:cell division protein FtsZ [Pontiella desulfatans]VGO15273.1 Cell division protein FtsZ [Pontiella desulfatans]
MSEPAKADGRGIAAPRMLVMGVGSSGVRAVAAMRQLNPGLDAVVIDTDTKVLEATSMDRVIHVGATVTRGFSSGGDVELGRQSIEKDSSSIRNQLRLVDLLVIVTGLGGGTGSGAVPVITRIAREAGSLVLVMAGMPFAFEGRKVARVAEEALKRIRTHADAIIRISNERLVDRSDAELPAEQAYARSHQVMMDGICGIWRLLTKNGVCGLDFSCLHTMLRNCDGYCHFASAEGSGDTRATRVAEGLAKHRLLNKGKLLEASEGVVVSLTGGHDLKLSEIEAVMNRLQELLPEEIWLNFGVVVDPAFEGRISAIALVAEHWKEPLVDDANRQMGFSFNRRQGLQQGELPLETAGKGEFTYVDPTIHNNQDLDVPAYIRRDIKLPR